MRRFVPFVAAIAVIGFCCLAQQPVVTETRRVRVGRDASEILRKINGRWWMQDNRLVSPPSTSGYSGFWTITSKPGVVEFYHHRPFDTRRAEQLRLFMTPDEVEAMFGQPNRRFPMRSARGGRWYYHASDGTILDLWFMGEDELGEANYLLPGKGEQPVASIERELGGRSIFSLLAARASERSMRVRSSHRTGQTGVSDSGRSAAEVAMRHAAEPSRPVQKRIVAKDALDAIQSGLTRDEVFARLGEPTYASSITSDDGVRETLTYHLDDGTPVSIRLLDGKVLQVR